MRKELTWQAVVSAFLVSAIIAASYPYVVLKLGLGPNVSVVSAFLGAILLLVLSPRTHGQNRLMNNIVQTAGTSASMIAFMCVIAAAVEMTASNPTAKDSLDGIKEIEPWPMFWWLCCSGGIGVLFMVLFRRHFIDDPKMIFADGVAAAETIVVLDTKGGEGAAKLRVLGLSALASAALDGLREVWKMVADFFPSSLFRSYRVGIEWSLLTIGSGILIGITVSLSMLAATLVVVATGPGLIDSGIGRDIVMSEIPEERHAAAEQLMNTDLSKLNEKEKAKLLKEAKQSYSPKLAYYMTEDYFPVLLLWYMWPATGLMICSAITAVLLKWRSIAESFRRLRMQSQQQNSEDVSLTTILVGSILLTAGLAVVQQMNFGMSYTQTIVAVLCSLPLILVGVRVLGETNNGPISVMMNGLQAVFAVFWPSHVGHNLIAAGMTGTCNAQGQGTIQDYKTGKLVGSTPRILTWVQLAAVPIGAAAVAIMYSLLTSRYKVGEDLTAPTAVKISGMAVLLSKGFEALPEGAMTWTIIASIVGIVLAVVQNYWHSPWIPSAAGFGFGLILPGTLNVPMAIGGILGWLWLRASRSSYDRFAVTVASGFIAGEALLGGLVLPIVGYLSSSG
jgi:OPT family oligopeptide transporter